MRKIVAFLVAILPFNAFSQISFYIDEELPFPDFSVKIGTSVSFPDIKVQIGENISFDDFTVGITDTKSKANFVIVTSKLQADKTVRASGDVSFPDISIQAGENVPFPDVRIEIRKTGSVDYLVYTEKAAISMNDLVVALLPAINQRLGYKFKDIPTYVEGDSDNNSNWQSTNNQYTDTIDLLRDASIIAQDDDRTFLGTITNGINSNSIFNDFGTYGNDISSNSIWNDIGVYGSEISPYSPFNNITSTPPMIVKNGKIVGYLTTNKMISGGISPIILKALKDKL